MQIPDGHATPVAAISKNPSQRRATVDTLVLRPQWSAPAEPLRHTWEGVVNIDQFRWMVRRDVQDQLALVQRELRARHVRAVGMFDDEMRVYRPGPGAFMGYEPDEPRTNWQIVDYVIDSLLDRDLHPMFTTSFVPSAMAGGPVTVFTTKAHTSPPADWKAWARLVQDGVRHAIERHSAEVVRQWYFEVWNEPNLDGWFWGGDRDAFLQLWKTTHDAIKSVDASLRVGGPSCARGEWVEELLEFGAKHDCAPDYIVAHTYNNDSPADKALAPFAGAQAAQNSTSPDFASTTIRNLRRALNTRGYRGEVHWNEWGRSFHGVDRRRETANEAAFAVRLLSDVSQDADAFAYWCLSDIYDQVGYGREAFHGGYGLLSLQGLRKPAYHAFQLLSRLGTQRVSVVSDDADTFRNVIVTAPENGRAHALVYAYAHDDPTTPASLKVSIELPSNARPGALYRIDSTENNVITRWKDLGAPAYLSRAQTAALAAVDQLQPSRTPVKLDHDASRSFAHFTMETPGVALLEIEC